MERQFGTWKERPFATCFLAFLSLILLAFAQPSLGQSNKILGEVELVGASKVERTSGVWIDGQYVGYLKELKGSKKILLLLQCARTTGGAWIS
jgi:hypothetical protein